MSRFDLQKTNKDPEEWGQIALQRVGNNGLQTHVFGGFAIAATVAVMSNPLTGALVAGYVLWSAVEKGRNQQKNFEAVRSGCVAHVLEDSEFRAYARQVGDEVVMKELTYATQEEYELSNAALDYLETKAPRSLIDTAINFGEQKARGEIALSNLHSGIQNLLVQTVNDVAHTPNHQFDIIKAMTDPIQNCVVIGAGSSGKGMVISNALRAIRVNKPNCKIYYIDPKNDPKEYGYLDGVAHVIKRKTCKGRPEKEISDWVDECLDDYLVWAAEQEEALLVVDEGTVLGDASKKTKNTRLGTHILHVSSLGGSAKEKVWLMAQSPYVGPMGLDLSTISQIVNVCIVSETNSNVIKQWKKSSMIEMADQQTLNELFRACTIPKYKRAIFWGGTAKWYAMPNLENYSSYDRDSDKPVGDALSSSERQELRDVTTATAVQAPPPKTDNTEQLINKLSRSRQTTLEDFISKDLRAPDRIEELRVAIVAMLREKSRTDLLEAFGLGWLAIPDPIEALKFGNFQDKSDEEIKTAWLLYTGQQLNDLGVSHLREKLGK